MGRRILQQPSSGAVLAAVRPCEHGSVVDVRTAKGCSSIEMPYEADVAGALELLAVMRRVDGATLVVEGDRLTASAQGVGHRTPTSRPVPVGVALGLVHFGIPVSLARALA
jgi:hypothetical protein